MRFLKFKIETAPNVIGAVRFIKLSVSVLYGAVRFSNREEFEKSLSKVHKKYVKNNNIIE